METKICTKCKSELPKTKEYFFSCKGFKDGLTYDCKKCRGYEYGLKRVKSFKSSNTHKKCTSCEKTLPKTKEYFTVNATTKEGFYSICKKCKNEKAKARYELTYQANKERLIENNRRYRSKYPEKITAVRRAYDSKHKVKLAIKAHNRRARFNELINNFTEDDWAKCKESFNYCCSYCRKKTMRLTQDHFIPLNKGGEYTAQNIIPACKSCNSSKRDYDFFEWYPKQKFCSKKNEMKVLKYLGYKNNTQQLALL